MTTKMARSTSSWGFAGLGGRVSFLGSPNFHRNALVMLPEVRATAFSAW